jgi:hypothetical protein
MENKMKLHNLINQRFGKAIVVKEIGIITRKSGKYKQKIQNWELLCDCGNTFITHSQNLLDKRTQFHSCGCSRVKDIKGQRFGNCVATKYVGRKHVGNQNRTTSTWECKCDCGKVFIVSTCNLQGGHTKSCGCYRSFHHSITPKDNYYVSDYTFFRRFEEQGKRRKLEFKITLIDIKNQLIKQNSKCQLSGLDININNGSASIDRINSSKGYIIDNIQIVHKTINFMKSTLSQEEFIKFCTLVATNCNHQQ